MARISSALLLVLVSCVAPVFAQTKSGVPTADDKPTYAVPKPYVIVVAGKVSKTDVIEADASCGRFYLPDGKTLAVMGTTGMKAWDLGNGNVAVFVPAGTLGQMGFCAWNKEGTGFNPVSVFPAKAMEGASNVVLSQPGENGFAWYKVFSTSAKATADVKLAADKADELRKKLTALNEDQSLDSDLAYLQADPAPAPKAVANKPAVK